MEHLIRVDLPGSIPRYIQNTFTAYGHQTSVDIITRVMRETISTEDHPRRSSAHKLQARTTN
eukprot:3506103-Prorocentrum_lima.AAC.1